MPASQKMVLIDTVSLPSQTVSEEQSALGKDDAMKKGEVLTSLSRVLVVEDDAPLREYCCHILEASRLLVDQSSNGHDALEKLSTNSYALVVTDLNLPGMNGISLLQWIQRHRPTTTAVAISGDGSAERILAAMRGGAKDFLVKPFSMSQFQEMIDRWCQPQRPFISEVFSSLMNQVMHDVRGEVLKLEGMIKLLQPDKFADTVEGDNTLLAMQKKLAQIKGLTADYCLLTKNLLAGNSDIPTERIGLRREVIDQVLGEMGEVLQHKEIKVSRDQDLSVAGEAYVLGNRLMLKNVFQSLFRNAIKHCKHAGVIWYGISSNGRRYKIHVTYEGNIISANLQGNIFDECVQGSPPSDSTSIQTEGIGLGLALAKGILHKHGGDIWYESMANGSKFVCTLPLCDEKVCG